jgi:hypothetical protein
MNVSRVRKKDSVMRIKFTKRIAIRHPKILGTALTCSGVNRKATIATILSMRIEGFSWVG